MKRVAIIGSHGLYANYGGLDQLVKNLTERKSDGIQYIIFNSADSPRVITVPTGVTVKRLLFKASGFQGLFYDFWSILICFRNVDTILLLGVQGIPIIPLLFFFKKINVVANVGGIEWERPKFGYLAKNYLRLCFNLSFKYSKTIILDNQYYTTFIPLKSKAKIEVVPYGGEIDNSLELSDELIKKYPFLPHEYFLSVSRALADNTLEELCASFTNSKHILVLISNFSSSSYGSKVFEKYFKETNIYLINGLYKKNELDLIRKYCKAYIHTHTLCGTAPSLIEMVIARRPIFSIDIPQNRFTLSNIGFFFKTFKEVQDLIQNENDLNDYIPPAELCETYAWNKIVKQYEDFF